MTRRGRSDPAGPLPGAGRCPVCASRRVSRLSNTGLRKVSKELYADTVEICGNPACRAVWEPFAVADLAVPTEPMSMFKTPCDNCAFRKGSPEQEDKEGWAKFLAEVRDGGVAFYCHKGVPIDASSKEGFLYPRHDTPAGRARLRPCRGYTNMVLAPVLKA